MQLLLPFLISLASFTATAEDAKRYEAFMGCETWNGALLACQEKSGRLAVIDNQGTQGRIARSIQSKGISHWGFWINGHDSTVEGHWTSEEGEPLTFFNWKRGQPDNDARANAGGCGGIGDCALLWPVNGFKWNDAICLKRFGYVCEFDTTGNAGGNRTAKSGQLLPSTGIPNHALRSGPSSLTSPVKDKPGIPVKRRYEAFAGCKTWHESKVTCEDKGGRLATITSQDTQTKIEAMLSQHGYTHLQLWFNLHDELMEGHWTTSDGNPQGYYNWATGQPNNNAGFAQCPGIEDCAVMTDSAGEYKWDDVVCVKQNGYICEFDVIDNDDTVSDVTPLLFNGTVSKNPPSKTTISTTNTELNDAPPTSSLIKPRNGGKPSPWSSRAQAPPEVKINITELVFPFINFLLFVGIVVFLYFLVWRKRNITATRQMFYKELERSQSTEILCSPKV